MRAIAALCTISLLLISLAACSSATGPAHEAETIKIVLPADIRGTNPGVDRDARTDDVIHHITEGLVAYRENMSVGLMLAESVNISADGKSYQFVLREGLKFHNGAPVTSAEVKWSWERMLDPKTNWLCRDAFNGSNGLKIDAIDTPDARNVVFHLNAPSAIFLPQMASFQCTAAILHPSSVDSKGGWVSPVATGPYKLGTWKRGQYIELVRFQEYKPRPEPMDGFAGGKSALVEKLRWIVIPDTASAKSALYARQVDLLNLLMPSDLAEVRGIPYIKVHKSSSLGRSSLLFQTSDPLLKDVRIRRAIAHSIDINKLTKVASMGTATPNPSVIPAIDPFYSSVQASGHSYDPAKARALLREAGYRGQKITIQTSKEFQNMYDNAVIAQSMMKEAGLNVGLSVVEWTTQFSNYMEGKFQMTTMDFSSRTDPVLGYDTILGLKSVDPANQWENDRAITLNREAGRIVDQKQRQALFDQMHREMLADVPFLNLYNDVVLDAASARLSGYKAWPTGKPRLWGVRFTE